LYFIWHPPHYVGVWGDPPAGPPPVSPLNIGYFGYLYRGVNVVREIFPEKNPKSDFFGKNPFENFPEFFLKIEKDL